MQKKVLLVVVLLLAIVGVAAGTQYMGMQSLRGDVGTGMQTGAAALIAACEARCDQNLGTCTSGMGPAYLTCVMQKTSCYSDCKKWFESAEPKPYVNPCNKCRIDFAICAAGKTDGQSLNDCYNADLECQKNNCASDERSKITDACSSVIAACIGQGKKPEECLKVYEDCRDKNTVECDKANAPACNGFCPPRDDGMIGDCTSANLGGTPVCGCFYRDKNPCKAFPNPTCADETSPPDLSLCSQQLHTIQDNGCKGSCVCLQSTSGKAIITCQHDYSFIPNQPGVPPTKLPETMVQ